MVETESNKPNEELLSNIKNIDVSNLMAGNILKDLLTKLPKLDEIIVKKQDILKKEEEILDKKEEYEEEIIETPHEYERETNSFTNCTFNFNK